MSRDLPGGIFRPVPARDGHRCGSCRFLDRVGGGGIGDVPGRWKCANFYTAMAHFVPLMTSCLAPPTPMRRLLAVRPDCAALGKDPRRPASPGWFACPLWLPGESMSAAAHRAGHYREFLALEALRGYTADIELEQRTRGAPAHDEGLGDLQAKVASWAAMRGLAEVAKSLVPPYALGSAATSAAESFEGLMELIATDYLTRGGTFVEMPRSPVGTNCRCWVDAAADMADDDWDDDEEDTLCAEP